MNVKADLDRVAAKATNLSEQERKMLLRLLQELKERFNGTLGQWNTEPIDIELKPNAKPKST